MLGLVCRAAEAQQASNLEAAADRNAFEEDSAIARPIDSGWCSTLTS